MIYPIMDANPNLLGCTLDLVNADTDALVSVFRSKVSAKVGTRVTNFITPLFHDLNEGGKRKTGCQFSAQRAKKEDVPVIHHEGGFEVKDCASVLPVISLPSNGSTAWADPYYGFTTPFFYTSATVVAWTLQSADILIGSGDEPIESHEWVGFNESLPDLVRLEHCVLRATLRASLYKLQTEVATLDALQGTPIFNEKFPSIGRKFDSYDRVQSFGKHHSIPINEWGENYHDFPHLENVTTDLHHDIQTQTGLPLNIETIAYVGALAAAQHWHRDFPCKVIPEVHHAFAVFFPLNYQLNGSQWIHGSSVGAISHLVALGTLHHLIAFHLILLCPVAPVAFFIRCCTHAPRITHLLLSSQVTVVQWPRLDLVQAPEAPDVAGSKVGHVAPAAEAFNGVGEEWFLPGPPTVFEATGFGNEVTLPEQAPSTTTHWCRSFKLKVRQGGVETV